MFVKILQMIKEGIDSLGSISVTRFFPGQHDGIVAGDVRRDRKVEPTGWVSGQHACLCWLGDRFKSRLVLIPELEGF